MYKEIKKYNEQFTKLHMPGHQLKSKWLLPELIQYDTTETSYSDHLYEPENILLSFRKKLSKFYRSKKSYFITNGSTGGIIASIFAAFNPGDHVIIGRNCHQSVYHACLMRQLKVSYLYPIYIEAYGIYGGVKVDELRHIIENSIDTENAIKGVVLTSPSYEGFILDIKSISNLVHAYHIPLIIDEAHGAHLVLDDNFPNQAGEEGADIVIQSLHKTLPALTQSAVLHLFTDRVAYRKIEEAIQFVHTSSPSYLMMAQMDFFLDQWESCHEKQFEWIKVKNKLLEKLTEDGRLIDLHQLDKEKYGIYEVDPVKLVIGSPSFDGINGFSFLSKNEKIEFETKGVHHIVGILGIEQKEEELEKLFLSLTKMKTEPYFYENNRVICDIMKSDKKMEMYAADRMNNQQIGIHEACNLVCGKMIVPYPPGIPLLVPGEVISLQHINWIDGFMSEGGKLIGIQKLTTGAASIECLLEIEENLV